MKGSILRTLFLLAALIPSVAGMAHDHENTAEETIPKGVTHFDLIENKGQWTPEAKFKANLPGGMMFVTDQGFVYHYLSEEDALKIDEYAAAGKDMSDLIIHHHAYKVTFVGAQANPQYATANKKSYYHNYFIGNNQSRWAGNVGLYGKIVQQEIYDGIDLALYSQPGSSLKYDFIVAAGADPGQIQLAFNGITPQLNETGDLVLKSSVNTVIEKAPYTYQEIEGEQVRVESRYKLENGRLSFEFPEGFNTAYPLIIDPTLIFATYSGGTSSYFYAHSTTYDQLGNMYVGAFADGSGWPTTTGAFQTNYPGANNVVSINKYTADGSNLIYSTYFGGNSGATTPNSMRVNDLNQLVVAGGTTSPTTPFTSGAYDTIYSGSSDIFVAQFTEDGTGLVGATFMGGSGNEASVMDLSNPSIPNYLIGANTSPVEILFDEDYNIWVVANSNSSDFPVTANAYQNTLGGGYDGVVFKIDSTCTNLIYSSYFGGSANDGIFNIGLTSSKSIAICGGTQSTDLPTTSGAYITTAPGGNWDGFVALLHPDSAVSLLSSTYLGTSSIDNATKLQVDPFDNIYVLGQTSGSYPVSPGVWSMPGTKTFIDKLSPDLSSSLLSTTLGRTSSSGYFPTAFLLDLCGNVYVAGMGYGMSNMPITNDAFDSNTKNFWFCVLKPNFSDLLFGSYFGTTVDHAHTGTSRFDPQGVVYHSVCSTSGSFPTTTGSWSYNKQNGGMNDIASFKFDFEATGVQSHIALPATQNDTICAPYTIQFKNSSTSPYDMIYLWDFDDNGATSTDSTPSYTFVNPGIYDVVLHAHSDSACITDDYDTMRIVVLQVTEPQITVSDTIVCSPEDEINLWVDIANPSPNTTVAWGPPGGIVSGATNDTVTVDPAINTMYYVTVRDTIPGICGISASDTIHIDFAPRALNILTSDTVVCEGSQVQVVAESSGGFTYLWTPNTGISDTTILNPVITVNQSETYTLTARHEGCPDTSQTLTIEMHEIPELDLGPDIEACQWEQVTLASTVTPFRNDYIYQWTPPGGLSDPNAPNAEYVADTSGTYVLSVETPIGCADVDSIHVTVHPGGFGSISTDTAFCPPQTVPLWASGGTSYQWEPAYGLDDASSATPMANPETTTDYTVYITNEHGCVDTEQVSVIVHPLAVINLPDSITVYPGEQYHLQPPTNCAYFEWFPTNGISSTSAADPYFYPSVRTRYFVTATTEYGCIVEDSMDVLVEGTVIDMPNAFTPGNGANNSFKPSKRGIAQIKEFSIFNRWGNQIFSTTNIDEGWDGTYNGKPQPTGVYLYRIEAVTIEGRIVRQTGDVTLIR